MKTKIENIIDGLSNNPNKENWEKFFKAIKTSDIKFYRIVFKKNVKKENDLTDAYAELYSKSNKLMFKIPIFMKEGKSVKGATIYLKELSNLNVIK